MRTPTRDRWRLVAVVATAGLLMVACGDDDDAATDTTDESTTETTGSEAPASGGDATAISIDNFEFVADSVTVDAGATVTWTNNDDATHSVKDDGDLGFESDDLVDGDTFEQTYDEPGEYPYVCGIHDYMKGTVVVE